MKVTQALFTFVALVSLNSNADRKITDLENDFDFGSILSVKSICSRSKEIKESEKKKIADLAITQLLMSVPLGTSQRTISSLALAKELKFSKLELANLKHTDGIKMNNGCYSHTVSGIFKIEYKAGEDNCIIEGGLKYVDSSSPLDLKKSIKKHECHKDGNDLYNLLEPTTKTWRTNFQTKPIPKAQGRT
jgi:hypothetical protein